MLLVENPAYLKRGLRMPPQRSRGLGDAAPVSWSDIGIPLPGTFTPGTQAQSSGSGGASPASDTSASWFPPGSTVSGALYNAATGQLSEDQKNALVQQESQALVKAGMDPSKALAQAKSDVNAVNPSQSNWITWLETYGPWIGLGLAGLLVAGFVIREAL